MLPINNEKKIKWACRRGMLELDCTLVPFFENRYASLTDQLKEDFVELLENSDPDLYSWIMGFSHTYPLKSTDIIKSIHKYIRDLQSV
ncbi:succinate dehydrogenase assembly factor 2 [Paraphotobacterium marinum]